MYLLKQPLDTAAILAAFQVPAASAVADALAGVIAKQFPALFS